MCRRTWSPPAQQPEPRCVLSWAAARQGRRSRKLAGAEAAKPEPELLRASAGRSRVLPQEAAGGAAARCRLLDPNNAKRRRQAVWAAAVSLAEQAEPEAA